MNIVCLNGAVEAWAALEEEQQMELLLLGPSQTCNAQAERRKDPNEQGTQGLTAVSDEELQLSLVLR